VRRSSEVGASAAADAAAPAFDADDDSAEDTEDATLPAGSRFALVGMDLLDQVPVALDGLGGDSGPVELGHGPLRPATD
jgi:hypothetical protein